MTNSKQPNLSVTLNDKHTLDIINRLCVATGMTPSCLIGLLVRKYGADLESWVGNAFSPVDSLPNQDEPAPIELPTDPGQNLPPVQL
jgi:hypothetical protein